MMTEAIATQESVSQAAAELEAAGTKVTAVAIRAHLGGGSQVTILRHLRNLRASSGPVFAPSQYPESFLRVLDAAKASIWDAAQREAAQAFEEERSAFLRCTKTDQEELQEAAARIDMLDGENTALRASIVREGDRASEVLQRLANAEDEVSRLRALENTLLQRAEAAEASDRAKADTIALLREFGIRPREGPPTNSGSDIDDVEIVSSGGSLGAGNETPSDAGSTRERVGDQSDLEDYLVATGRLDDADD